MRSLRLIHGGLSMPPKRVRAPHLPGRQPTSVQVANSARAERTHRAAVTVVHNQWQAILDVLGIRHTEASFPSIDEARVLWLPGPRQAILAAANLRKSTLARTDAIDHAIGPRQFVTRADDLDEDIRVIIGLAGGRFFGHRGGSLSVHASLGLYRCARCRDWWFLCEWSGWQCQCCGFYDGNCTMSESYTDVVSRLGEAS